MHFRKSQTLLAIIDKYGAPISQWSWLYQALSDVLNEQNNIVNSCLWRLLDSQMSIIASNTKEDIVKGLKQFKWLKNTSKHMDIMSAVEAFASN